MDKHGINMDKPPILIIFIGELCIGIGQAALATMACAPSAPEPSAWLEARARFHHEKMEIWMV